MSSLRSRDGSLRDFVRKVPRTLRVERSTRIRALYNLRHILVTEYIKGYFLRDFTFCRFKRNVKLSRQLEKYNGDAQFASVGATQVRRNWKY